MAELETHIVRAWAVDDPPSDGGAPLVLLRRKEDGTFEEIVRHDTGVSSDPGFRHDGEEHDLTALLDRNLLVKDALVAAVGTELYRRLALGEVGTSLANLGFDQRVLLDLRSPSLELLPWELLRRNNRLLFQIERHPWLLGRAERPPRDPLSLGQVPLAPPPLRILLVIGNDPTDPKVQGDAELRLLEDCLHDCREVLLHVLERPRPQEIVDALGNFEPHIFHFIGHGATVAGKAVLRVYSASDPAERWDADRIRLVLGNVRVPRLVILNACQTASVGPAVWSLSEAFLGSGVGALIAMQAEILGEAALTFAKNLYLALKEGLPIDVATVRARSKVALDGSPPSRASWSIPRLMVRGDPDAVVRMVATDPGECPVRAPADFVHRWTERHRACRILFPEKGDAARLVVLEGPPKSGKSELLKVLGEIWSHAGHDALYVDLGGSGSSELALVIERTRNVAAKAGFDTAPLDTLVSRVENPPPTARELAGEFRQALETLADSRRLLLLLDGLENWQQELVVNTVIPEMCVPFTVSDEGSKVRLAVALPRDFSQLFGWDALGFEPVRVESFMPHEWRRAAAEFLRWHTRGREDALAWLWQSARLEPPDKLLDDRTSYSPEALGSIRRLKQTLGTP